MTDTYNKVAGALDESRALLAEVMAALTAAAERERVLREALERITATAEQHTMRGFTSGQIWTYYEVQGDVIDAARAALEATK